MQGVDTISEHIQLRLVHKIGDIDKCGWIWSHLTDKSLGFGSPARAKSLTFATRVALVGSPSG